MKKTLLSAAIAAVSLAGFSQGAFALAPSVTPDIEIYMSGATAQDKALKNIFDTNLCSAATLHIYKSANLTDHQAFFCTIPANTVAGITVDKNVLFHKRSAGGSAQGVGPLIDGTAIAHMEVSTTSCVTSGPGAGTGTDANPYICSTLVNKLSDAGISDVEPTLFTGPNKPSNAAAVNAAAADAALTVVPAAALLFGVPVSDNLYVALQLAQGLRTASACNTAATEYTDACMPSLSKQQVAELISGQIKKWSEFKVGGIALTTLVGAATYTDSDATVRNVTPTDTKVHYCKRIDGSGTGAQQYAKFLNNPCSTAGLDPDWLGSTLAGPVKHEVSGSGDMEKCLEDFADGEIAAKQITTTNPDVFNTAVNTLNNRAWAIGMQSLEANPTHAKHYRFIKVDGVAPTLANAFAGKYMDWVEQTYQWRKGAAAANVLNPVTADEVAILTKIAEQAGNPTIIGTDINVPFIHAFGQSGYLAIGKNFAFTDTLNPAAPIMPYSHAVKGSLNNCQVPVIPSSTNVSKPM